MAPHVVLIGLMGSGKTSVAQELAARLGEEALDNDALLEAASGLDARSFEERHGVERLHQRELEVLEAAIDRPGAAVITAAASVVERPQAAEVLARAEVVWLRTTVTTLLARLRDDLADDDSHRPERGDLEELLASQARRRRPAYQAVADLVVDTDGATPAEIAERIEQWLEQRSPTTEEPAHGTGDVPGPAEPKR